VDFDDLLALTYKILDSNEELAQQISQKYQYIMVDEYQDTNELQLMLLKKLCHTHKNLCVVGDDDQSIYGWRGAHIRNIIEFDQDFTDAKVIKLQKNYRSTNQILKVANTLINHNRGRIGKELESTKGDGKEVIVLNSFDENEEARKISKYIQNLVDEGVKHKDIAILYRVNVLSRSLEEGLNRAGINYKLVGGLRFYERAEIKDLVSYLRIMVNVHDDFSLKRIINKPKRGIGKASLEKIELAAHSKGQSIFEYLDTVSVEELESLVKKKNTKTLKNFVEDVKFVAQSAKDSMYNFIDVLEETFKLKEIYKNTPDEVEKTLNIDEFYALFRDFVKNNPEAELIEFLNDISLQSDQDEIEGESIFMMSIHAAKGLEFEHVFVVGLEEGFLPITGEGSDLEEERRLGYVAFTRAKESLTLSHANSRFYKGRRSDLEKSRFINEAGLCEGSLKVEKTAGFKKGDLVRHKIFGAGRVIGVGKSGKEYKLSINFGGTKRDILSSFVEKL